MIKGEIDLFMSKTVKCPYCGKSSEYNPSNVYRPFCSERCQLIDLGEWASGRYGIPAEEATPPEESSSQNETETKEED